MRFQTTLVPGQPTGGQPIAKSFGGGVDRVGVCVSTVCAVHCAAVPLLAAALPGLGLWVGELVEWIVLGSVAVLVAVSLATSDLRHRSRGIVALFAVGLALLLGVRLAEYYDRTSSCYAGAAAAVGGLLIAAAHVANRRRRCRHVVGPRGSA